MGVSLKGRLLSLTRRAIGKLDLARLYPSMDYVSNAAMFALARYTSQSAQEVSHVCVVGVHNGDEAYTFLKLYPTCHVHLYEPSTRYLPRLQRRFGGNNRVTIRPVAASDTNGTATFYETNFHGAGSLLKIGDQGVKTFGLTNAEEFEVQTVTLDDDFSGDVCDCLWIDVQGAEMLVLQGAQDLLKRTKTIHIEVTANAGLYEGDDDFATITEFLEPFGFRLALLGMDGGQGNALYFRDGETIR